MMDIKKELEARIAEKYTLGNYTFDIEKKCFYGDVKIQLYLFEVSNDIYRSCDVYYFDDLEFALTDEETEDLIFYGDKNTVKQQAIAKFNEDAPKFMGYKIVYENISLLFVEKQHLF